ncbi:DUF58 domain-containing protein [Aestuariirhabdus sp. Z084]|uniref:DUF58 domain-containing protein n=1 Tax=Aestuariirhabdus haliotis TaxID=2918751 RepID=UPI00201B3569|nr:DUF58 domain-containing protein [Aestuariirhabdus haliotis]MCL6414552.1 DUF58 domain-containing protein [Aestuariirhabdus haliotis]MCL6418466.1 DUF58 domain-containing protein [Aestuariirhabdus haliotis]
MPGIRNKLRTLFNGWISRRIPAHSRVTLNHRRIFIVPTRTGYLFLLLIAAVFLAGVNYQNSMSFAVAFLLTSLFVVAIHHTYNNLAGLTLIGVRAGAGHLGDDLPFRLELNAGGKVDRYAIELGWPQGIQQSVTVVPGEALPLTLYLPAPRRGIFRPGRLRVQTRYPLGLLVAWSWVDLDLAALVYPRPLSAVLPAGVSSHGEGELMDEVSGVDDFSSIREYQPGDALNHLAWKQSSRHQQLFTKEFVSSRERRLWLDWEVTTGHVEIRLSHLCYWCLQAEREQEDYGLRLPGIEIAPSHGQHHLEHCLKALALCQL